MNHAPWLIRIGAAAVVTVTAASGALALPVHESAVLLAACSATEDRPDSTMTADGYIQAAYRLVCPGARSTGVTLGLYYHPHETGSGELIAQTQCTAAGTTVDCQVSAPCRIGGWDIALGTDTTWPADYRVPDFDWEPSGQDWTTSSCPRFVPGVQTIVFGDGS